MTTETEEEKILIEYLEEYPSSSITEITLGTGIEANKVKNLLEKYEASHKIIKVADTYSLK